MRKEQRSIEKRVSSRIAYLDFARGLAMLAVIWGHIHTAGASYVLAYAFDIPLFFFMSGMMYSKEKTEHLPNY